MIDSTWLPTYDALPPMRMRHGPNEILPGVWLGDRIDAQAYWDDPKWQVIDVRESDTQRDPAHVIRIPLLRKDTDYKAGRRALEEISEAINRARAKDKLVLVHCWQGIERGPLSIVGWLVLSQGYTLDDAYRLLMRLRGVANRREWLTKNARKALTKGAQRAAA